MYGSKHKKKTSTKKAPSKKKASLPKKGPNACSGKRKPRRKKK